MPDRALKYYSKMMKINRKFRPKLLQFLLVTRKSNRHLKLHRVMSLRMTYRTISFPAIPSRIVYAIYIDYHIFIGPKASTYHPINHQKLISSNALLKNSVRVFCISGAELATCSRISSALLTSSLASRNSGSTLFMLVASIGLDGTGEKDASSNAIVSCATVSTQSNHFHTKRVRRNTTRKWLPSCDTKPRKEGRTTLTASSNARC